MGDIATCLNCPICGEAPKRRVTAGYVYLTCNSDRTHYVSAHGGFEGQAIARWSRRSEQLQARLMRQGDDDALQMIGSLRGEIAQLKRELEVARAMVPSREEREAIAAHARHYANGSCGRDDRPPTASLVLAWLDRYAAAIGGSDVER